MTMYIFRRTGPSQGALFGVALSALVLTFGCGANATISNAQPSPRAVAAVNATNCDDASTNPQDLGDLAAPEKKDIAMQLVSSAENSSLNWRQQYRYLEDINDGRGYTGGLIGFTSATGDMLQLVRDYTNTQPDNPLAPFIPALESVNGTDSHAGLGQPFEAAWVEASTNPDYQPDFEAAQDNVRDTLYFNPAVSLAKSDGLPVLGQFVYYDAAVVHGPGNAPDTLGAIRATALTKAKTPAQGGNLRCYLDAFWDARIVVMKKEPAHSDVSRITDLEIKFANDNNYNVDPPLQWKVYGDTYNIA